jgi:hypothetical protein
MRAKIHLLWIVAAFASAVSCTALLGLSDKSFDGAGGSGGSGVTASAASTSGMSSGLSSTSSTSASSSGSSMLPDTVVWAIYSTTTGAQGTPQIGGIAVDSAQNTWLTGTVWDNTIFQAGSCVLSINQPQPPAKPHAFWAKLGVDGTCVASGVYGNEFSESYGKSIVIDGATVVIVGKFAGKLDIGMLSLTSATDADFVLQLDRNNPKGAPNWLQSFREIQDAGSGTAEATSVVTWGGFFFVGGNYTGTFRTTTSEGGRDIFLLQIGVTGSVLKFSTIGSNDEDFLESIAVSQPTGDIALTGQLGGAAVGFPNPCTITPKNFPSAFAALLTASTLACQYTASNISIAVPQGASRGRGVAVDSTGKLLSLVGDFTNTLEFGSTLSSPSVVGKHTSDTDGFVGALALPNQGSSELVSLGQNQSDTAVADSLRAIAVDGNNAVVIAGSVGLAATLVNNQVNSYNDLENIFVAKFKTPAPGSLGSVSWIRTFGAQGSPASASAVALDPSNEEVIVAGEVTGYVDLGYGHTIGQPGTQKELFVMRLLP